MRFLRVALVLTAFFVFFFLFVKKPFYLSSDLAAPKEFTKRASIPRQDFLKFVHYSEKAKKSLSEVDDKNLIAFKCSDTFIRTVQGVYLLENEKAENKEKRRVKNTEFIEFMRKKEPSLSTGKRIMSGRICELKNGTTILFYSTGKYNFQDADYQTPRLVILNSFDNEVFVEVIPKFSFGNKIFQIGKSANNMRCDKPFQFTNENTMHILCQDKEAWMSTFSVYEVSLKDGSYRVIEKCITQFRDTVEKSVCI